MSTFREKSQSAGKSIRKFFIKVGIVLVLLAIGVTLFLYYMSYSEGVRAGVVLKVSKRGAVFKTYEGQLDIMSFGAIKKADNQLTQTFEFSMYKSDQELIHNLEQVALSGERVNLYYEEKYAMLPWRGETKYFVTKVERLEKRPENQVEKESFPR